MDSAQHNATSISDACTSAYDLAHDNEKYRTIKLRVVEGAQLLLCSRRQEGQIMSIWRSARTSTQLVKAVQNLSALPAAIYKHLAACAACSMSIHGRRTL
jgi:hypothetical protein